MMNTGPFEIQTEALIDELKSVFVNYVSKNIMALTGVYFGFIFLNKIKNERNFSKIAKTRISLLDLMSPSNN